jgi:Rod binding domain-containing protein
VSPTDAITMPVPVDPDAGRLDSLKRAAPGLARREAARQVETLFLTQLLRAMRRTVPENDFLPRSPARDVYEGMFDRSIAEAVGRGDPLGLVERLGGDPGGGLKDLRQPADTGVGDQKRR